MNAAKMTLTSTILAAALGLALMFNFATGSAPAFAAPPPDECKGQNKKNPECQGDDTGREDTAPATSGFDNAGGDAISSDCANGGDPNGNQCYVHGEDRVNSTLGGKRPARYELLVHKSTHRRVGREITLDLSGCAIADGFGCDRLQEILGPNVALDNVTINGFVLVLRPYATNCPPGARPEGVNCGDLNVFTMAPGPTVPMGLWIYFGESQLQLDFASQIDPRSSIDPGRGLEVCEAEDIEVGDLDDVMVTASEDGFFVDTPDQNNSWEVEVAGGSALVYLTDQDQECVAKITDMSFLMRIERRE